MRIGGGERGIIPLLTVQKKVTGVLDMFKKIWSRLQMRVWEGPHPSKHLFQICKFSALVGQFQNFQDLSPPQRPCVVVYVE